MRSSASLEPMKVRCSGLSSNCTGSSSFEGLGQVFTSSRMSSSSKYMLSTVFCFMDAE